ncbi:MAG: undecaprenyldiphospho-muramoylpentapeptide beta-N-acetylglucosaminyltransferase [Methylococcales symbiont of Hymedesmia sp. n. MRB-2018]|nr:MAG: undecaprenyldiphospho-muramoylpentapeptide beta-N-acetylglucosaminyltransferase [Methylococcales symbiont of Hymedesmia sp. n. MRB-2018]
MDKRIVIMAGGTGGHVFPALAVAQYLSDKGWDVSWIGTKNGLESKVVPANGIEIDWLEVKGLRGKGLAAKICSVIFLFKSLAQALKILRKRKPHIVLGMGGYVAAPGGIIASLMNIPLVIHEQNRVPGTTNRLLKKRANKVLEAFPNSFEKSVNAIFTGNPLRKYFLDLAEKDLWTEKKERDFRVLIVGGSLGAKILNDIVPTVLANLDAIEVKHQTGAASLKRVKQQYTENLVKADTFDFIEDMATAYQWADMIICRSGAMTVSEVAAVGLPAIFIPLPHAIDDHQTANATYLTDSGAAVLIRQNALNETSLLQAIEQVKKSLLKMSATAKKQAKLKATKRVATICEQEASH